MAIYVEILIRAPMDALWAHTQDPELHQLWDLRFSSITYLPRRDSVEPQRFRYATRMGLAMEISGEGESVGERDLANGSRSSSLKFSSADPRSIIREGTGYWKYLPTLEGIRFLTWYEYRTRFGPLGALFDRVIFQPLMGWATAWSFDRLRLWLEERVDPTQALKHAVIHAVARVSIALIFFYHGLVPKLLIPDPEEMAMLHDAGITVENLGTAVRVIGIAEILFALSFLVFWHRRFPAFACVALMALGAIGIGLTSPRYLTAALNPVSLNLAVACLAAIDLMVVGQLPSARRCRRRPVPESP